MDVLESREAVLRAKVLGTSPSHTNAAPLVDRLRTLYSQLDHLCAATTGSVKLRELCAFLCLFNMNKIRKSIKLFCMTVDREHADHLQLTSATSFANDSSRAGDELKRAAILSSVDRLQHVTAQLQQMQQLASVLDNLHSPSSHVQTPLTHVEEQIDLQSEAALAIHRRVENVLAMYQQMILVLSEKCVEYDALLNQI
ncbi:hypothetical protein CCR75_006330 [Bremia lactucae]|uniref:Dynactin subunit 3 n=1 Tax=Bremia lactucae TaxID=4779 RepID=A0A976IGM9_BRELC|nr:hypothetical protein CCR75_006330 [Bremia lactucae]